MPKWTDYTIKTNPTDNDEVMVLDTAGNANKRLGLSALSDWILNKLADKVFQKLETNNKTVLGAINELNSNRASAILTKISEIPSGDKVLFFRSGAENIVASTYLTIPTWSIGIYFPVNQDAAIICVNPEKVTAGYKTNDTWRAVKIS